MKCTLEGCTPTAATLPGSSILGNLVTGGVGLRHQPPAIGWESSGFLGDLDIRFEGEPSGFHSNYRIQESSSAAYIDACL
jgi:hypothetical protein